MTFEEFDRYITIIRNQEDKETRVSKALEEILDGRFVPMFAPEMSIAFVNFIAKCLHDKHEIIEWWLYEYRDEEPEKIQFWQNDIPVPMKTTRNLYDYLQWDSHKKDGDVYPN